MWVARDADGRLYLFVETPSKHAGWHYPGWWDGRDDYTQIDPELFPEVKWEDNAPRKVKLVLEEEL